jgi:hypothetical protein
MLRNLGTRTLSHAVHLRRDSLARSAIALTGSPLTLATARAEFLSMFHV